MRLLLDTHVAIWALASPHMLSDEVRTLIADPDNDVYVSAASVWEIALKHALARRGRPPFSGTEAIGHFRQAGYALLAVEAAHAAAVERLPPLHGDPFDRMLIAQARTEPLRLVTSDTAVAEYGDDIIRFRAGAGGGAPARS